ncbi:MAG: putative (di)nucleoside polyphosphate hydrolase [Chlamydiales bacterium]|jgi:ADP-ribose pyrophosphatase YjhB (NUDIX family)|nr:putative (di)nucleoside polyphosphate hydrolase [Chlamydiales bacterium]
MERQFTASVAIIKDDKTLLILHRKLGVWLPPGGHIEANELPHEAALREGLEETGLYLRLIPQENIFFQENRARSIFRPYSCALQDIPVYKEQPFHQHIDFLYIAEPIDEQTPIENLLETKGLQWFSKEELEELAVEHKIFQETKTVLISILEQFKTKFNHPSVIASHDHNHTGIYAIIIKGEQLLTIKKGKGPYKGLLDLPGGTPIHSEHPLTTVIREVKEETGVTVHEALLWDNLSTLYNYTENNKQHRLHHTGMVYRVDSFDDKGLLEELSYEDSLGAYWLDPIEANLEQLTPFTAEVIQRLFRSY